MHELQARGILLDGTTEGGKLRLLLQIFSQTMLGPVFFEFIQRKGGRVTITFELSTGAA